jgi:hypothetical protein
MIKLFLVVIYKNIGGNVINGSKSDHCNKNSNLSTEMTTLKLVRGSELTSVSTIAPTTPNNHL